MRDAKSKYTEASFVSSFWMREIVDDLFLGYLVKASVCGNWLASHRKVLFHYLNVYVVTLIAVLVLLERRVGGKVLNRWVCHHVLTVLTNSHKQTKHASIRIFAYESLSASTICLTGRFSTSAHVSWVKSP